MSTLQLSPTLPIASPEVQLRRQAKLDYLKQCRENEASNGTVTVRPEQSGGFLSIALLVTTGLMAVSIILYMSAHYLGEGLSRGGHSDSKQTLEIIVANSVLGIPENTLRFAAQRKTGVQKQVEMYLHWPTLSGYKESLKEAFSNPASSQNLLFITIEPRTMSHDMSGRLSPIYSKFFEGIGIVENNGLVRQPLGQQGGYIDEDIYFESNNPYPFTARCVREIANIGLPMCIRDIHIGKDLMLTYRFHKSFLNTWRPLETAIRKYAEALLVNETIEIRR